MAGDTGRGQTLNILGEHKRKDDSKTKNLSKILHREGESEIKRTRSKVTIEPYREIVIWFSHQRSLDAK